MTPSSTYDVAVIGAGPVGCVTALAFADLGGRVLVLEQNPRAAERLAGEWLHPAAVDILAEVGVTRGDLASAAVGHPAEPHPSGQGFVVFPDDASAPMELPYGEGRRGHSCEHSVLVGVLRERVAAHPDIDLRMGVRATAIEGQRLTFEGRHGHGDTIEAALIVGAGGRMSIAHEALGIEQTTATYSRMAGLLLKDAVLPSEGFGHVMLGGPGPALAYRLDPEHIRVCLDVPLAVRVNREPAAVLGEAYRHILPEPLQKAFIAALQTQRIAWAKNQIRPRISHGREGLVLVGDAVGHHHPLTALGMTLGFQDAIALVEHRAAGKPFAEYRNTRLLKSRVPEMLAVALYEVFADNGDEVVAMRRAVYDLWRGDPEERRQTMAYLGADDVSALHFGGSFLRAITHASRSLVAETLESGQWRHLYGVTRELSRRARWLVSGALHLTAAKPSREPGAAAEGSYGQALEAASPKADVVEHPASAALAVRRRDRQGAPLAALERSVRALKRRQRADGSWEGECVWCAMLPAQYVILCHLTGRAIDPQRRRRILRQLEVTQLPSGAWGLYDEHIPGPPSTPGSEPYLFVTSLAYVAARMLGVGPDDALLVRARAFLDGEGGVVAIPSWGKLWLALAGLYEWQGVNPVLPEVWSLPRWVPLHPSNYYCHTRLIYLGMASLYGRRLAVPDPALNAALRRELYPQGYDAVDFRAARSTLREAEIFTPPSLALRAGYEVLSWVERAHRPERREAIVAELCEHIRFELRTSDHTSISPVSGMLNILALSVHDPGCPELARAWERFEGWIWQDDERGLRIAGARSATWDSAFATQALAHAAGHFDLSTTLERADAFLQSQQIRGQTADYAAHYRVDPNGGYCFAGVWHGWPVSDCTAEAMCARLLAPDGRATEEEMTAAATFLLRTQNADGGFGSYESQKTRLPLEWLNPAEMFGDSMTEHSYAECTASCIAALRACRQRYPDVMGDRIDPAVERATRRLRLQQRPDGTWNAAWGVHYIYGTMFGIRGLREAGVPPQDPAIRKACAWLRRHQRPDGGFGEHTSTCLSGTYTEHPQSQVIQTAWALTALLEAHDADWDAIERAAHFLAASQREDGEWPKQDPAGIFFHTALLDYELYRCYFPVWALSLYETRRLQRLPLLGEVKVPSPPRRPMQPPTGPSLA